MRIKYLKHSKAIVEGEFDKIADLYIRTDYEGAVKILYYIYYQSIIQIALIIMGCILLAIAIYLFTFSDISEIEHPKRKWLRRIVFFIGSAEDLKRLEAKDFQKYTGRIYLRM